MKKVIYAILAVSFVLLAVGLSCKDSKKSDYVSRSYKGHASDVDSNNFVNVYPDTLGTRLDDCVTCHKGGTAEDNESDTITYNSCTYCHLIPYPDNSLVTGAPTTYLDTLNQYGVDYLNAGRTRAALRTIETIDSDNDSYTNIDEIEDLRFPGDNASYPGKAAAPTITLTLDQIKEFESHTQLLLMNSHKQRYDTYAYYTGVKIMTLLDCAGVDLTNATSITIIAADGYQKDFDLEDISEQYPDSLWYSGLGIAAPPDGLGTEQGFVEYPTAEFIPAGLADGDPLPFDQWVIIAYGRDDLDLDISYLDPTTGRLNGEGPFRIIVPQTTPGSPDRGSSYSPTDFADGWDYDATKDHNAGLAVKGIVAIRINPMPEEYEEFDWKEGGYYLAEQGMFVLYGCGVSE